MLNILPTVTLFSNLDLMNGTQGTRPFFFMSRNFQESSDRITLGGEVYLDKATSSIVIGKQSVPMKRFVKTAYDKTMHLHTDVKLLNFASNINVIYMSNYKTFLVLDDIMYNSLYIQLMVLEDYNKDLFEAVILKPNVKIYKLKV